MYFQRNIKLRKVRSKSLLVSGVTLFLTITAFAQSEVTDVNRGSLPNGVLEEQATLPTKSRQQVQMKSLKEVELETIRSLPLGDPALLEESFGTVSKTADGEIVEKEAPSAVLDALRRIGASKDVQSGAVVNTVPDPLFGEDEQGRQVIGPDDRIRVRDSASYPFRTFGYLSMGCSATIIGRYTVITAAHCVYDHDSGWAENVSFYPGLNGQGNLPYGEYQYEQMWIPSGYISRYQGYYGSVVPWDLAIIRLQRAAGDRLGWLGVSMNNYRDFTAYMVGYPGDKEIFTMWRTKCDIDLSDKTDVDVSDIRVAEVVHQCDMYPGSSGSSMYRYFKQGGEAYRYVEAINVAELKGADINFSVLFTEPHFDWIVDLLK